MTAGPAGDDADRRRLADALMPDIAALAARYAETSGLEERELLAAGMRGLERALQHYVPEPRTPFGPYAMWWIRQAMETLRAGGRG
jgi:DNA-directed RNA polymerase sigma subunit (sigma70/sigma32)